MLGGMLLGLSAALLLFFNGKIAGISGIVARIHQVKSGDTSWRILFVLGMVVGGVLSAKLLNVAPAEMVVSTH